MTIEHEAEDLFITFLKTLPDSELKELYNGYDVLNAIPEDAIEDFKDELWEIVKRSVEYSLILQKAKEDLPESEPDEESSDEDEDEED
jgi:hypothetical protein